MEMMDLFIDDVMFSSSIVLFAFFEFEARGGDK